MNTLVNTFEKLFEKKDGIAVLCTVDKVGNALEMFF